MNHFFQFIVVMSGVNYTAAYYGTYVFPPWAEGIGWILAVVPICCVIIGIIFALVKHKDVSFLVEIIIVQILSIQCRNVIVKQDGKSCTQPAAMGRETLYIAVYHRRLLALKSNNIQPVDVVCVSAGYNNVFKLNTNAGEHEGSVLFYH